MAAVELDDTVLAAAQEQAAHEGVPLRQYLDQAVRRQVLAGSVQARSRALVATLRELQARGPKLDEDEGLALARDELQAMRAERRAAG